MLYFYELLNGISALKPEKKVMIVAMTMKKYLTDGMPMVKFSSLWLKELGKNTRSNILNLMEILAHMKNCICSVL